MMISVRCNIRGLYCDLPLARVCGRLAVAHTYVAQCRVMSRVRSHVRVFRGLEL